MASNYGSESSVWSDDSEEIVNDLYDQFDALDSRGAECDTIPSIFRSSAPRVVDLNPHEIAKIVEYDNWNERLILSNINSLHFVLHNCDKMVGAGQMFLDNRLRIPSGSTGAKIKQLLDKLTELKRVRYVVSLSVSSIADLAKTIQIAAEHLNFNKGSESSVELVRKNIPSALVHLDNRIEEAARLDAIVIDIFESNNLLQDEIGVTNMIKEISQIRTQMSRLESEQKDSYVDIRCKQGEVARFGHLLSATQDNMEQTHANIESKERRIEAFIKLNSEIEKKLEDIPPLSTAEHCRWWYWWSKNIKTTKKTNEKVRKDRKDRIKEGAEHEGRYYESIIKARHKHLFAFINQSDTKLMKKSLNEWKDFYNTYNAAYIKAKAQLEKEINNVFPSQMIKYQNEMLKYQGETEELSGESEAISGSKGLLALGRNVRKRSTAEIERFKTVINPEHDSMLIAWSADIRAFSESIEQNNSTFSPLADILQQIKTLVTNDMQLLSSPDRTDIFVAGKRLMRQAECLIKYSERLIYL